MNSLVISFEAVILVDMLPRIYTRLVIGYFTRNQDLFKRYKSSVIIFIKTVVLLYFTTFSSSNVHTETYKTFRLESFKNLASSKILPIKYL